MSQPDKLDLPSCLLFDALAPEQHDDVLDLMQRTEFRAGDVILEDRGKTRGLWIIVQGRCQVLKEVPPGSPPRVLAELDRGAVFGEMSFYSAVPHSAAVRAQTDVTVLHLAVADYRRLERNNAAAAYCITLSIATILAERLRRMDEWTDRLLRECPPQRHEEWAEFRGKLYNDWEL